MEVRIQAIHFEIADRLNSFVEKKIQRLARHNDSITTVDVNLRLIKPETAMNKEATIRVNLPGGELVSNKVADTFEEAFDVAMDAIERQLERRKAANRE